MKDNGVDHVGRKRLLIHQLVVSRRDAPALFSPLFLEPLTLPNLPHEDKGIHHRLCEEVEPSSLSKGMPKPNELSAALRMVRYGNSLLRPCFTPWPIPVSRWPCWKAPPK